MAGTFWIVTHKYVHVPRHLCILLNTQTKIKRPLISWGVKLQRSRRYRRFCHFHCVWNLKIKVKGVHGGSSNLPWKWIWVFFLSEVTVLFHFFFIDRHTLFSKVQHFVYGSVRESVVQRGFWWGANLTLGFICFFLQTFRFISYLSKTLLKILHFSS